MTHLLPAPVVTLDGPSGSGKGTVGQLLATRIGWNFLDSGALYRTVGFIAHEQGIGLNNPSILVNLTNSLNLRFVPQPEGLVRVLWGDRDLGSAIRTESAGDAASKVAAFPEIRTALLQKQHEMRRLPGLVADGRDMGTVVFPDAILKIFLTASAEIRAERRYKQLREKGFDVNLRRLLDDIRERDARDAGREVSPLRPAADASILDTSNLTIPEVVDHVEGLLHERLR